MHESIANSSTNVSNWSGALWITPFLGAYIADTHWGRYWTFIVFSVIYILGMILLTLTVSLPSLRPPACKSDSNICEKASKLQIGIFYLALYVLAVGAGGTKANISTMGADQFDDFDPKEKLQKASFFNWWLFTVFSGLLLGNIFLVYIQDRVGFAFGYGMSTAGLIISVIIFLIGTPFYRHKVQKGSPFIRMAQVIVAAARKWRVSLPSDPTHLYEVDPKEYVAEGRSPISLTPTLRFLEKAATKDGSFRPWKLCPITQVEETKIVIRMLSIWVAMFMPHTLVSLLSTLFIKQGTRLNRHMGSHFEIPPGSLASFHIVSMLVTIVVYDRVLVRIFRRFTGNPRGITILRRIGIGMVFHIVTMVVASVTEMKRIRFVKAHGIEGNEKAIAPLTVFILLPQFLLGGIADAFLQGGALEFFYDQAPESMQSIGTSLFASTLGIGSFLNSFPLNVTVKISGRKGHTSWILNNLNASRIYYYYALMALLSILNLIFFLFVSRFYVYKRETTEAFRSHSHGHVGTATAECHALPMDMKAPADEMEMVKV